MKFSVIKAYFIKEYIELYRSKVIFILYIMPIMIMILFGYGIKLEVTHAKTIIIDNDNSIFSQKIIEKFLHSKYFNTKVLQISENEALKSIKRAKTDILIIIPSSFEKNILHNQKSEIGVFIDGSFPIRAITMESYVKGVLLDAAMKTATMFGKKMDGLITINQRALFNQAMRDENAIVPGLFGLILLVAPAILSALLIVKEKENGTIFNFYSSPVKKDEFIIGKLSTAFLLYSSAIFLLFLIATYIFSVPFRGSFIIFWFVSEIYVLISISIGLLISIITNRQIVALVVTVIITIIPGFLYSGMLMPISSMKSESYIEAHIFPVMYYNHIVYDTFLIGQGFSSFKNIEYLVILIFYALTILTISYTLLKKEMR